MRLTRQRTRVLIITSVPILGIFGSGRRVDAFEILFLIQACNLALYLITAPLHRQARKVSRPFFFYHLAVMVVFGFSLSHLVVWFWFRPISAYFAILGFLGTWFALLLMYVWALLSTVASCVCPANGSVAAAGPVDSLEQPPAPYENGAGGAGGRREY